MMRFSAIILLYFLVIQKSFGEIPTYSCSTDIIRREDLNLCFVKDAHLTSTMKHFKLKLPDRNVSDITRFEFYDSKVAILTNDVCETLPNIERFDANHLGLVSIDVNAFQMCIDLKSVSLVGNSLETLPLALFDLNIKLTAVQIGWNRLTSLDENLFKNNINLDYLAVQSNQLTALPWHLLSHSPRLRELHLRYNQLTQLSIDHEMPELYLMYLEHNKLADIDILDWLENAPKLQIINVGGNDFSCDRKKEIIKIFSQKNISTDDLMYKEAEKCIGSPESSHVSLI